MRVGYTRETSLGKAQLQSTRYACIYAKGEEQVDLRALLRRTTKSVETAVGRESTPYSFVYAKDKNVDDVRTVARGGVFPVETSVAREQKSFETRGIQQGKADEKASQVGQEEQRIINAIVEDIQTDGSWNSIAGDLAVSAVTQLPTWPVSSCLKIGEYAYYYDGTLHDTAGDRTSVALQLNSGHYSPIIEGQVKSVASDGNCFYHSLLLALGEGGQRALLGGAFVKHRRRSATDDHNNPNVGTLRQMLATHLHRHPELIIAFLEKHFIPYQEGTV